jgi:putative colanic acid biosynthesis glycosyltransferase WcaI
MRLLVLGTNYAPEKTAVSPFTTGLCEHLASGGHEVTVITTFPYYPEWKTWDGYRGRLYQRERINNVAVRRVWHYVPRRGCNLLERLAHDFSFTVSAFLAGLFIRTFDVIYCACPPPTLAFTAYALARLHRKPYVIKLTDLASDAALATGILKKGFAVLVARAIEGFVYRQAQEIVCLCQAFIEKLVARGIAREKLKLISDWGDTKKVYPIAGATRFRRANGLSEEQFLVMHTGNMGKKQDLFNVVRAAELSQGMPELVWLLVGNGEERAAIEEEIAQCNLRNLRLLPLQSVDGLAEMYSAADVLLLNQKATMKDAVIPSKLLTYMAAGRAVLAAVSEKSEAARLIKHARCGLRVPAEDPQALVDAVLMLRRTPDLRQRFGANGRVYADQNFTKQRVLQEYGVLFSRYAGEAERQPEVCKKAAAAQSFSKFP